jgi:hypothetical protein
MSSISTSSSSSPRGGSSGLGDGLGAAFVTVTILLGRVVPVPQELKDATLKVKTCLRKAAEDKRVMVFIGFDSFNKFSKKNNIKMSRNTQYKSQQ